jgi:beta-lactamase regulating signal transducer with metallopeptidase domain
LLAGIGLAAAVLLRVASVQSPALHRAAWCITLLAGWTFLRLAVSVPWYPAEAVALPPNVVTTQELPPLDDVAGRLPPFLEESIAPLQIQASETPAAALAAATPTFKMPQVRWQSVVMLGWATGMASIVVWWLLAYLRFVYRLPRPLPCKPEWQEEWARLQREQGSASGIALRVTSSLGPLLCRLPRGAELLVPAGLWQTLGRDERQAILRHELAHHLRRDVWKSLAMRVLALPHWFNPVAWLAVRRFDEAAEWACDRVAMGTEPTAYARMLLRLGELASARLPLGSAMSNLPLTNRIRRLLSLETKEDSAMKKSLLMTLLLLIVPLASVQVSLVAEQPPSPKAVPTPDSSRSDLPPPIPPDATPPTLEKAVSPYAVPEGGRAAERKMAESAKLAYEGTLAAYFAQNAPLDSVIAWSNRWLNAELAIASTRAAQISAARAHLARMRERQLAANQLAKLQSRGGESWVVATADYYVADAERRLAEIEAKAPPAINLFESPVQPQVSTAKTQRAQAAPERVKPEQKQNLRYEGKTFDEWADEFEGELSPVKRTQALDAMGEFAAHGFGSQAAEVIFRVMRDYSVWITGENSPEGKLKDAALEAAMRVPPAERLPHFVAALLSGTKNQKLFALRVVPLELDPQQIIPALVAAVQDPDLQIVELARAPLAIADHDNPELVASIRRGLASSHATDVYNAIWTVRGCPLVGPGRVATISRPYPALLPEALAILDRDDSQLRETALNVLKGSVHGPVQLEYLEALETAVGAGGSQAEHASKLLDSFDKSELLKPQP